MRQTLGKRLLLLGFAVFFIVPALSAQAFPPSQRFIQAGGGIVPGIGIQGGYFSRGDFITTEVAGYFHMVPALLGGESTFLFSLGAGGSLRILHILNMAGTTDVPDYQFDAGLRLGPSFFYVVGGENANPFSLFLDLFVRGARELPDGRTLFVELGIHEPLVRAGFWIRL